MTSTSITTTTTLTPAFRRSPDRRQTYTSLRTSSVRLTSPPIKLRSPSSSSSAALQSAPDLISNEKVIVKNRSFLACPICYDPLTWTGDSNLSIESTPGTTLECNTCKKAYYGNNESCFDLTVASGAKDYSESMPLITELFRFPLVSSLYERSVREIVGPVGGYTGPTKEFEMAKEYLKTAFGGNIVDASCGGGVFSRLFAKSGLFSPVIALDYSETMMQQCYESVMEDPAVPKEKLILVRADISRLPFVSGSIDAVHASSALHCWPSPSTAVAEISRVLRPGGVFVGSTTIAEGPFTMVPFRSYLRENLQQLLGARVFLSERELEDLCTACGLVDFTCVRNGLYVLISATKPS